MSDSILNSTKKVLGIDATYTAFDQDIAMYINSAFSVLNQLGVGPTEGFFINDDTAEWDDFIDDPRLLNLVKTYVLLKVRYLFDPPTMSFLIDAVNNQIKEYEWRISVLRDELAA